MSKRRDLETQIHSLGEIKEIMNAMKNLSLMEIHRVSRFLDTQHRVVTSIESAADDFLSFYSHLVPREEGSRDIYLLVGSERGFCGDFNDAVVRALDSYAHVAQETAVFVIGNKLAAKLAGDRRIAAFLDGASISDEVAPVLTRLMESLSSPNARHVGNGPLRLTVFHHAANEEAVVVSALRPFRRLESESIRFAYPPLLNFKPQLFLAGLVEQYLFAALHELLYRSLMAENQRRMQHMDSAVRRLERTSSDLLLRRNTLRQEEITEEIEIIMLSVEALE